jgi:hypothetical protein
MTPKASRRELVGTSRSPAELTAKLQRAAHAYADLDGTVVREGAQLTKRTVVAGAPSRLRGVGKRGARLSVGYTVSTAGSSPAALVFARGPWQFIENDTAPHRIPRSSARKRKARHAVVPGGAEGGDHGKGGVRASVNHPGTRGKHPWAKGVARAAPQVAVMFQTRSVAVLRVVF